MLHKSEVVPHTHTNTRTLMHAPLTDTKNGLFNCVQTFKKCFYYSRVQYATVNRVYFFQAVMKKIRIILFTYGDEDISKTVATICVIFSGKINYTNMNTMSLGFVPHFSLKGNIFIFHRPIYCKFGS